MSGSNKSPVFRYGFFILLFFCYLSYFISVNAWAAPAQVILMRHAEKPVFNEGTELNAKGLQRAKALVEFFISNPIVTEYGTPKAIYSMAPKDEEGSIRSIQTMIPLSQKLGLPLKKKFTKKKVTQLVNEIMKAQEYEGKMVLICWGHDSLQEIAMEFGYDKTPKWKSETYDRVWILDFQGDEVINFRNLPQRLLPGDSAR